MRAIASLRTYKAAAATAATLLALSGCASVDDNNSGASTAAKRDLATYAREAHNSDINDLRAFYTRVADAVAQDDIDSIAALTRYPLRYGNDDNRAHGEPSLIETPDKLHALYGTIFTNNIRRVLACRTPEDFFINAEGVMVGNGAFWFALTYIGTNEVVRPLDSYPDGEDWQLRIIAVYDGKHAERDAAECEQDRATQ